MNESRIKCIIVDDDLLFQTILKGFIDKTGFLEVEGVFSNAIDAAGFLSDHPVDLIFLDVEMPEMSGFELLRALEDPAQIILISSQNEYAIEAFEYNVTDYLLKPIDDYSRFVKAVLRTRAVIDKQKAKHNSYERYVFIKEDNRFIKIDLESIYFVQAFGDYIKIITKEKTHIIYDNLKEIKEKLPGIDFIQVHRSFIVRIDKIDSLDASVLKVNNQLIPVSRSFKKEVLDRIKML